MAFYVAVSILALSKVRFELFGFFKNKQKIDGALNSFDIQKV